MTAIDAYNEALKSGHYQKLTGLLGKYDNVRRLWEDEELGLFLRPYLERLIARKRECSQKLRLMDLGCGSGDGLDIVTNITSNSSISEPKTTVLPYDMIELYHGIDINEGLMRQAQAIYGDTQNVVFTKSDFNDYDFSGEEPYDLYLANYGTLSHNNDEQTVELLSNIAKYSQDAALIMIDWLGRFSYEWQAIWTKDFEHNQWMDYAISYIYSGEGVKQPELVYFPLRIVGRAEVLHIYRQVKRKVGSSIILRKIADRSSFVGRHMDTARYNPHCQPIRRSVSSLFEPKLCTNLDDVLILYVPKDGFPEVNIYYQRLADCWNHLITYTKALLEGSKLPGAPAEMPMSLRRALSVMRKVIRMASRVKIGNPRASLVEPQLGYCLRELEMGLQQGLGCGHGLVAVFEIVK